jgi:hypothetical protein
MDTVMEKRKIQKNRTSLVHTDYWVSRCCPSSGILENGKYDVSETGSISVFR